MKGEGGAHLILEKFREEGIARTGIGKEEKRSNEQKARVTHRTRGAAFREKVELLLLRCLDAAVVLLQVVVQARGASFLDPDGDEVWKAARLRAPRQSVAAATVAAAVFLFLTLLVAVGITRFKNLPSAAITCCSKAGYRALKRARRAAAVVAVLRAAFGVVDDSDDDNDDDDGAVDVK
eukprot:CAMPEP_0171734208 /NCGR_PEP_ID=MMETSP0991-20121206/30777_1 /TAXON_ID=483369 /ORGANISM="non described non described, Strain CCMP2098" /LENGTH=178 /DNA_ID=CAMNT_0012330143 /DNA_START=260 /DNA_END=798 /DNA_ORIENTATION=+